MNLDIPLKVLVCDPNPITGEALTGQLRKHRAVLTIDYAEGLEAAQERLRADAINTIFIDPFTRSVDSATEFIFTVRKNLPEIVFVLYMDVATAEAQRSKFFQGERQRFSHYYTLDKATPVPLFPDEVGFSRSNVPGRLELAHVERQFTAA
jgi:hypothetical protein